MHKDLIEQIPFGIAKLSSEGKFIYCNSKFLELLELSDKSMLPKNIFGICTNENREELKKVIEKISSIQKNSIFKCKENGKCFEMNFSMIENNALVLSLRDNSNEIKLEEIIQNDKEDIKRLNDAIKGSNIGVWDFFPQDNNILTNETWVTQKKYKSEDFRERESLFAPLIDGLNKWSSLVHPDDLEQTINLIQKHLNGETDIYEAEFRMMCGDGKYRWIYDLGQVFQRDENGAAIRMNGVHIDISNIKKMQKELNNKTKELELLASLDPLTKLYNRRYFSKNSEYLFDLAKKEKNKLSIIMLDIDNFKTINDTYGHKVGDNAIVSIATLLKKHCKESDIICRFGGDEFLILLPDSSENNAHMVAKNIHTIINEASIVINKDKKISCEVSIGLSHIDRVKDLNIEDMIHRVDTALYTAKNKGKNTTCVL